MPQVKLDRTSFKSDKTNTKKGKALKDRMKEQYRLGRGREVGSHRWKEVGEVGGKARWWKRKEKLRMLGLS